MKVYVVVQGERYEGYSIVDIFADKDKAEALKKKLEVEIQYDCDYVDLEEWDVTE